MKTLCLATLIFTVGTIFSVRTGASEDNSAAMQLNSVRVDIESKHIGRIDILFIPYDTLTRVRIDEKGIEKYFQKKISINKYHSSIPGLLLALNKTRSYRTEKKADIRWAAIMYDESGSRIHEIYLDGMYIGGSGRIGRIDDMDVLLNSALVDWFEGNFLFKDGF